MTTASPYYLLLHYTDGAGLCCWCTDDLYHDDAGSSGAGYTSCLEAVNDVVGDTPPERESPGVVVDLTDLGSQGYGALLPDSGNRDALHALIDQRGVPISIWLATHQDQTPPG